jgi:uncharacterized UPF0160 family protein
MYMFDVKNIVTHDGIFHGDDVFACALVRLGFPEVEIQRDRKTAEALANDESKPATTLVLDAGGKLAPSSGLFDHHQREGVPTRSSTGLPYATFGLILHSELGMHICQTMADVILKARGEEFAKVGASSVVQKAIEKIASQIDARDTGGPKEDSPLSDVVSSHLPPWYATQEEVNACFEDAIDFAELVLKKVVESALTFHVAEHVWLLALEDPKQVVSPPVWFRDQFVPRSAKVSQELLERGINFVGYPDMSGKYALAQASREARRIPDAWLNNPPEGCTFVHQNQFLAVFESREDCQKAVIKDFNLLSHDAVQY